MKTFLPYIFRKIGIALFFISFIVSIIASIDDAIIAGEEKFEKISQKYDTNELEKQNGPSNLLLTNNQRRNLKNAGFILALAGLLLYSFSKEKVDDEFLQKLRANALLKSFITSWLIFALVMLIKQSTKADLLGILQIQMFVYVIVYAYTKKVKYAG
ncbi:hypothetical protein J1N10_11995 [Carboxylicivirga sp. A043]|uniref:hypothetical protein n=1 Tax=Carboxylicivirga litoralis TaxID=2816963 RepID=UPI0021CAEC7F|nr:hypothetical protein [Carboxylicivirga sp. A043]MCU4156701.1 hypothetical protein [Carboxylicivirga sp. A043]